MPGSDLELAAAETGAVQLPHRSRRIFAQRELHVAIPLVLRLPLCLDQEAFANGTDRLECLFQFILASTEADASHKHGAGGGLWRLVLHCGGVLSSLANVLCL